MNWKTIETRAKQTLDFLVKLLMAALCLCLAGVALHFSARGEWVVAIASMVGLVFLVVVGVYAYASDRADQEEK